MIIILFVDTFPSLSETFISNKVKELSLRGMHVVVFCVNHNQKLFDRLFAKNNHVEMVVLSKAKIAKFLLLNPITVIESLFNATNLRQRLFRRFRISMIRKYQPDIVHFEFSGIGVDYLHEIKKLDCKKVVSCRGSAEKVKLLIHEERKEKFRELLASVDAVHCVSEDMRETILPYCDDPDKIFINYPSIDTSFFERNGNTKTEKDILTILSVGRFTFQKGFNTGLQAIHLLKQRGIKFKWIIVGSGPGFEEMSYIIDHLQISDVVKLAGSKSSVEVKMLMQESDIFFLPSVYEGIANVALEAMSMGLPLVSTRSGGMEEVIVNEVNGLLGNVFDHAVLSLLLERLCKDKQLRCMLGRAARKTIIRKFDIHIQTDKYLEIYSNLTQKKVPDVSELKSVPRSDIKISVKKENPLHIGVIVPQFPTLSETFFINKVTGLCERGHKVTVFGSTKPSDASISSLYALDKFENLQIVNLDFKSSLALFLKTFFLHPLSFFKSIHLNPLVFRKNLHINLCKASTNRQKCDVYHFGYSGTAIFYHELFSSLKGKTMISCRGTAENVKLVSEKERIKKLMELLIRVDKIHCVSASMANTIRSYGAPADKIFINHPAIDTAFFTRSIPYEFHDKITILSIGRLVFQKGFIIGILALKELKEKFSDFIWKIVGDGPEMEELTIHINSLGLNNNVQLLGKKDRYEIKKLYQEADIYFLPSVSEGLANAVLEGMSMSMPVVSSDVGGMQEAITHNVDGKLAPNYSHKEMAQQLFELCTDFDLRKRLGEAARKTAVSRFDIKRYIDVFEQAYYDVLQ